MTWPLRTVTVRLPFMINKPDQFRFRSHLLTQIYFINHYICRWTIGRTREQQTYRTSNWSWLCRELLKIVPLYQSKIRWILLVFNSKKKKWNSIPILFDQLPSVCLCNCCFGYIVNADCSFISFFFLNLVAFHEGFLKN